MYMYGTLRFVCENIDNGFCQNYRISVHNLNLKKKKRIVQNIVVPCAYVSVWFWFGFKTNQNHTKTIRKPFQAETIPVPRTDRFLVWYWFGFNVRTQVCSCRMVLEVTCLSQYCTSGTPSNPKCAWVRVNHYVYTYVYKQNYMDTGLDENHVFVIGVTLRQYQ